MANRNLAKLQELSVKYGVEFQPLYSSKALEKGNLNCVHQALIGGVKYTALGTMNNGDLESIFKNVAEGIHESSMTKVSSKKNSRQGNTVKFNKDGNTVYINGRKYNVFNVLKDVEVGNLIDFLTEKELSKRVKDHELIEKITAWFNDSENFYKIFCYKLGVDYSQSAKTFAEYVKRDELTPSDMRNDLTDYNGSIRNYSIDILIGMDDEVEPNLENLKKVEQCLTKYIGA